MGQATNIQKLTARHFKILDMCVAGINPLEISKQLGMSARQISTIVNSPSFAHQFAVRRESVEKIQAENQSDEIDEVKRVLTESALDAANKLIGGLSSQDEKINLKSAVEILDRTGYPKEQKISGPEAATQVIINTKDLNILQESFNLTTHNSASKTESDTDSGS